MRALLTLGCSLALAVPLLPATAVASPAPLAAAPAGSVAAGALAAAPSAASVRLAVSAPAVPGARRYTGTISSSVRQVIVVKARTWRSTAGTLTVYSRTGNGAWRKLTSMPARLGYSGLVLARNRKQGSGKTPAGKFSITETFGRKSDPGTAMRYTKLTDDHWWVQDRRSAYYNQMRLGRLGGFARTTGGYYGSEHLARMGPQYDYAAVVDFNRPNPVIGRGSGIFLHAYGDRTTVGCVSVRPDRMRAILRWLSPSASPRIIIGENDWLARPRG